MFHSAFIVTGLAAYTATQNLGISQQCLGALKGLDTDPAASACLSPSSLFALETISPNSSLLPVLNNWLTNLCGQPACSNDTFTAAAQNIATDCATGDKDSTSAIYNYFLTTYLPEHYLTLRKLACLKSGNDLCLIKTSTSIEDTAGPFSINNMLYNSTFLTRRIPQEVECSDCSKASLNVLAQDYPQLASGIKDDVRKRCGANFVDGAPVPGISQSASTAPAGSKQNSTASANSQQTSTASAGSKQNSSALGAFSFLNNSFKLGVVLGILAFFVFLA